MKNIIYYTIGEMPGPCFATVALYSKGDKYAAPIHDQIEMFATFHEAEQFITELQKPVYFDLFGTSYELQFLRPESDEWQSLMDKWDAFHNKFTELLNYAIAEETAPWYKKLYRKILSYFSKRADLLQ